MTTPPAITPSHLVTINLKFGSKAKPYRTIAIAHLIAKVLFLQTAPVGERRIAAEVARLIGVQKVDKQTIARGLDYLKELNSVVNNDAVWALSAEARERIAEDIRRTESDLAGVLSRNFGTALDSSALRQWFLAASAAVFSRFSDYIVAAATRGGQRPTYERLSLESLLRPIISKHSLTAHASVLLDGYHSFLDSTEVSDHSYFMNLVQALFSARLVAADVGVEVIMLEEFDGATVVLDTNILFATMLEEHRLGKSVRALLRALQQIRVRAVYLHRTKEEFEAALHARRKEILSLVNAYKPEVIRDVQDPFVSTAVSRGCVSLRDYETFFDSLRDLPNELCEGFPLAKLDDEKIEEAFQRSDKDASLQQRLQDVALSLRPPPRKGQKKSERSLHHDAALLTVIEAERQVGGKWWVLSLDRSLAACARERTSRTGLPAVVGVDALIEILAADGSGPNFKADDFAPLMGRMMVMDSAPPSNAYTTADLDVLRQLNEEAMVASPEVTKRVAALVAKARLEGKGAESTATQLEVTRVLQLDRITGGVALDQLRERIAAAESRAAEANTTVAEREAQLIAMTSQEVRRETMSRLRRTLAWRAPVTLGVAALVWWGTRELVPSGSTADFVSMLLALISAAGVGWRLIPNAIQNYRRQQAQSEEIARDRVFRNPA